VPPAIERIGALELKVGIERQGVGRGGVDAGADRAG
jgi:hypothetical protein